MGVGRLQPVDARLAKFALRAVAHDAVGYLVGQPAGPASLPGLLPSSFSRMRVLQFQISCIDGLGA